MATIKEIKQELAQINSLTDEKWSIFTEDERAGVQTAVKQRCKQIQADLDEEIRLENMLAYERELNAAGYQLIAGIDEVGRGPLAGPVLAAAVILPVGCKIKYLNDSKQIPKSKHTEIFEQVKAQAISIGIGVVDHEKIDEVNIYQATKLAMIEAVSQLKPQPEQLLIDAMQLDLPIAQTSIIHGDATSLSIAAASIVAKVTRDQMMTDFAIKYPHYDFEHNAGYGTAKHLAGLRVHGLCEIHRKTYEPIKSMMNTQI